MSMGLVEEDASHSLFAKTAGRVNGPLKDDWGRQLRKTTTEQSRYGQLQKTFDYGTKLRCIAPFPHLSLKSAFVCIT